MYELEYRARIAYTMHFYACSFVCYDDLSAEFVKVDSEKQILCNIQHRERGVETLEAA